jgi:hypothetical protein
MKLFAQQGYGKGDKLHRGLNDQSLDGVILSPRDEKEENLSSLKKELEQNYPASEILLDPQFYYATYIDGVSKNLDSLSYYPGKLTLSSLRSLRNINQYVTNCLLFQHKLNLHTLVSPTILIPSFTDRYAQISLNMAEESIAEAKKIGKPLLVSLVFSESALNDSRSVDEFLNELTMLDTEGFYITVARNNTSYDQKFDEVTPLVNLLTMIYSLGEINEYKVIMGYSDIVGLLYLAVGAYGISNGWHNSLRKFTIQQRILPVSGGRLPRERYTSLPLLNSILVSELDSIAKVLKEYNGNLQDYLSQTPYDHIILSGSSPSAGWSRAISHLQHWSALKQGINSIKDLEISDRLDEIEKQIDHAKALYKILQSLAIQFDSSSSGHHLDNWDTALKQFRNTHQV